VHLATDKNIKPQLLKSRLERDLPFLVSHRKVAVSARLRTIQAKNYQAPVDARQSAVLISIFNDNGRLKFPLILRNTYEGVHSNQIGLPGGKLEIGESHKEAALREFEEELGFGIDPNYLLGHLSSVYIPPSNFNLKPYVSFGGALPSFIPDSKEVSEVFLPSIDELMNSEVTEKRVLIKNSTLNVKCFILQEQIVWGATAAILSEFKDVLLEISL